MPKSRTYKVISLLLAVCLLLSLTACGKSAKEEPQLSAPVQSALPTAEPSEAVTEVKTMPGYVCTEIENPDWLASFGGSEIVGDTIYLVARTTDGAVEIAGFDTVSEQWQHYSLEIGQAVNPQPSLFSATEDSFWLLFRENVTDEESANNDFSRELGYFLLHVDRAAGTQTWRPVNFCSGNTYFMSFIALDSGRALLGDGGKTYLIDSEANEIGSPALNLQGDGLHARIGGRLYSQSEAGLAEIDTATLQFGSPIEAIYDQSVYCSSLGRFLTTKDSILYSVDPATGEETELFRWMDVALSYSRLYGWTGLENSNGDIFHITDRISKISKGEVPLRKTLTLACLGDASGEDYALVNGSYFCSDKLKDAIIRFNNSDPEFRVEIRPFIYHDDTERSKILMDISTGDEVDLIDTSLLPEGAVDRQLLVDMLPYIDADETISREDSIPTLLNSMMKGGGIYEYVDRYTLLTMYTHPELAQDAWTVENIKSLIARHPELNVPGGQDRLISLFSWAASAEFMDKNNGTANFDSPEFARWLDLLKTLVETGEEFATGQQLFVISYDYAREAGFRTRTAMRGDYLTVGFPGADGTGSYFMPLGKPGSMGNLGAFTEAMYTLGSATSLGIIASSANHDGAWRFVRTFIVGEEEPQLRKGISALKDSFEAAITAELAWSTEQKDLPYEVFNQQDADALRELVYNTEKIVSTDEAVMDVMTAAINAYLGGKSTAEETAQQIQSRMSIYMAEQYG